jgi:hypothetical protein
VLGASFSLVFQPSTDNTMAESLDEFFAESSFVNSPINNEATLIHQYLSGTLNLQSTIQRIVQSLQARAAPSADSQYDLDELIEGVIVSLAEELPEIHDQLVTFLGALKQQSETSNIEASLAYSLNERGLRYGDPAQSLSSRDDVRDEWTNLNHFAALIYKAGVQDFSDFGVQTLEYALKTHGWRVNWDGQSKYFPSLMSGVVSLHIC